MTIRSILLTMPLLLFGWLATLSAVTLITDEAPAYVVLFPSGKLVNYLPDNSAIVSANGFSITLTSDTAGFAYSLYKRGAFLVLPARLTGCLRISRIS